MKKLPHNPTVRHHAWSDDPERDRRVRLAEDGRTEPGPTLEEAIAAVWEAFPTHRLLTDGEIIQEGDEYLADGVEWWKNTYGSLIGKEFFSSELKPHRRRVTNTGGET